MINRKAYDKLPKDLQAIVKSAMQVVATDFCYENHDLNSNALQKLKTEFKDVKIMKFPKPVLEAMKKANDEIISELEKKGGITKEIIESQRAYKKKAREWTKVSDFYYLNSMLEIGE